MITRNRLISILLLLGGLSAGYLASRGLSSYLAISAVEKDLSEINRLRPSPDSGYLPLPLRLVDIGGLGVLPDTLNWGSNYDHHQHYFEDLMLVNPPFIDTLTYRREHGKMAAYAGRMSSFGYNAIALPMFLEFINFDKIGNGRQVYGDESIYRERHNKLSEAFGKIMTLAADSGLHTYLWTDMVSLTTPLNDYLEDRFGSINTEDPGLWEVYASAAEEAFEKFPFVDGIIIRIGEAGSIYNKPGWDYRSELYVKTDKAVKLMLEAFLDAAEKYNRRIIFRTWSVGVGKIGDMHTNPDTYDRVLGDINSDHLLVSTKYCGGDFYSWQRLNPTLYEGNHRRIVEMQAKREFEGFGSMPNFVGPIHQSALQSFLANNSRIEGVWMWTQYGGPLRAGPMVIYPFHGIHSITDVSVYVTSKLMEEPYADIDSLTAGWIRGYFGEDSLLVARLTGFLNSSHDVLCSGLYISEFAKYDVRALGLEPPPQLWIFEWDILGGSSAVFSNIYYLTRDRFNAVLDEGFEAVRSSIIMKDMLLGVRDRVSMNLEEFDRLVSAVEYQVDLFRLLDYYRQYFMHYYRWIDTGDPGSATQYRVAMGQCRAMIDYHNKKYQGNLNTLGMDFEEALTGMDIAARSGWTIRLARVLAVIAFFLLFMGIPGFIRDRAHRKYAGTLYFDALFRPYRISELDAYHGKKRVLLFLLTIYLASLFIFSSLDALVFALSLGSLGILFIVVLALFMNPGQHLAKVLITLLAPKVLLMSLILVIAAWRGPQAFWYWFWTSDLFRMVFVSIYVMLILRKFQIYLVMGRKWGRRNNAAALAILLLALGIQIMAAGLALHFFGLEESLTALNNEILVLPAGLSKIMGITTHLDIPLNLPERMILYSMVPLVPSTLILIFNRKRNLY